MADDLLRRCQVRSVARGGPGGQHANKTASGVRLLHTGSGCEAMCCEHREGAVNRAGALHRLRLQIACRVRGGADPAWLRPLVRGGRLGCKAGAASWPAVVAVLLDALAVAKGDLKQAAEVCALSTSQLAKALTSDQVVRRSADAIRAATGLPAIRA